MSVIDDSGDRDDQHNARCRPAEEGRPGPGQRFASVDTVRGACGRGRCRWFDAIGLSVREYTRLREDGYGTDRMQAVLTAHGLRLAELEVIVGFAVSAQAASLEPIPGVRYTDAATLSRFFEMADAFGVRHVQAVEPSPRTCARGRRRRGVSQVCATKAAEHGLLVALEFVPATNVPDADVARKIVQGAGRGKRRGFR